ncbi:MAG: prepilin-type N-terminal cleavage/methylation domain-containing protein [Candidatus Omnitrophica bacterium]|nr:prepilin-type N-terminal cleavage/methylation domain-containing protein [Candidatus Omnitrophota bacterium]
MANKGFYQHKASSKNAFTLVEMIIALAATGLILGAAYATLFSGLDSYRYSAYRAETYSVLQRSLDKMFEDLTCAHLSKSGGRFLIESDSIEHDVYGEVPLDRIRFQSLVSRVNWDDVPQEDLSEVEYYIDTDTETPARWLVRRIDSPVDSNLSEGGSIHLVGPRVLGLEIQAYNGSEWVDEWDSTNSFPQEILIKLYMEPPKSSGITDRILSLSSSVWIPGSKGQASQSTASGSGEQSESAAGGEAQP